MILNARMDVPISVPSSMKSAGLVLAAAEMDRIQPVLDGWTRVDADVIDVLTCDSFVTDGWAPTSVVIKYSLAAIPSREDVLEYSRLELASTFLRGVLRSIIDISNSAFSVGMSGSYHYDDLHIWSDTQYIFDTSRGLLRQHTLSCRDEDRERLRDAITPLRDWFIAEAVRGPDVAE